jgi:hypothetical protein
VTDDIPYLVRTGQLQADAGKVLYEGLSEEGWDTCTFEYRKAGSIGESVITCRFSDGREESLEVPKALIRAMRELRDEMASLGKGAWLSMTMTVDHAAHLTCTYNYDQRPRWRISPPDQAYVDDLERYPRPADQVPDWYPRDS